VQYLDGLRNERSFDAADTEAGHSLRYEADTLRNDTAALRNESAALRNVDSSAWRNDSAALRNVDSSAANEADAVRNETDPASRDLTAERAQDNRFQPEGSKWAPGMFDNLGSGWQRDQAGNFVTMGKDGRLLAHDDRGNLVDYESHMNQKYMANQDQLALTSILFCSPLMLLGLGAGFAFMDQRHAANLKTSVDAMKGKFRSTRGYDNDLTRKSLLVTQRVRSNDADMNGLAGFSQSTREREEAAMRRRRIDERRKMALSAIDDRVRRESRRSLTRTDGSSLTREKLAEHKRKLEEHIEKVRGKSTLKEMSQLYAQMELLDRALQRLSQLGA